MLAKRTVNSIIGFLACGWAAVSTSLLFWNHESRSRIPLWLLFVIGGVAICYGFGSGCIGTSFSALIPFFFLIAPLDPSDGMLDLYLHDRCGGVRSASCLSASPRLGVPTSHPICMTSNLDDDLRAAQRNGTAGSNLRVSEEKHEIESV